MAPSESDRVPSPESPAAAKLPHAAAVPQLGQNFTPAAICVPQFAQAWG